MAEVSDRAGYGGKEAWVVAPRRRTIDYQCYFACCHRLDCLLLIVHGREVYDVSGDVLHVLAHLRSTAGSIGERTST
eukprot:10334807-Karenia_brevis.AAC.1